MHRKPRIIVRNAQRGMTLVEIMIVVAIIGLVMGAVVVAAVPALEKARCKTAWTETQEIKHAISLFQTDNNGDCPSVEQLISGKYLPKKPVDPWGQDFKASNTQDDETNCPGVYSTGRNKKDGDDDDVRGWVKLEEACKAK